MNSKWNKHSVCEHTFVEEWQKTCVSPSHLVSARDSYLLTPWRRLSQNDFQEEMTTVVVVTTAEGSTLAEGQILAAALGSQAVFCSGGRSSCVYKEKTKRGCVFPALFSTPVSGLLVTPHHLQRALFSMHKTRACSLALSVCSTRAAWHYWQMSNLHKLQACSMMTVGSLLPFLQSSEPEAVLSTLPAPPISDASVVSGGLSKHQRQQAVIDATGRQLSVF